MLTLSQVTQALLGPGVGKKYLEITNYYEGMSAPIVAEKKVIVAHNIKPALKLDGDPSHSQTEIKNITSDQYFYEKSREEKFDVILLDGIHTFEQTFRDLQNALLSLSDDGIIIIDDIIPNSYLASLSDVSLLSRIRKLHQSDDLSWMGDVYKLAFIIDGYFPQFSFATVQETERQLVMWRAPRPPAVTAAMNLEQISRLSYADILDRQSDFNIAPFEDIVVSARSGALLVGGGGASRLESPFVASSADQLRARQAPWAEVVVGPEGRRLIAEEETFPLAELRCTNENTLMEFARGTYDSLNTERQRSVPAIYAYALENVAILPHGALFTDGKFVDEPLSRIPEGVFRKELAEYYTSINDLHRANIVVSDCRTPLIVMEQPGMFNYGHVLIEMIPKIIPFLSELRSGAIKLALQRKYASYNHITGILTYLKLGPETITWIDIEGNDNTDLVQVPKLIYVSPVSRHNQPSYKAPWAIRALSEMVLPIAPSSKKKIFVSRKDAYGRFLVNEDEIFDIFRPLGYERVCTGAMTFEEQVAIFKGASHVAGVYGASLTNIVFCNARCKILILCPSNSVDAFYWEIASIRGSSYVQVAGPPVDGQEHDRNCDFRIDNQDVRNILYDFDH